MSDLMSHDLRDLAAVLDSDYPLDRAAKKILNAADKIKGLESEVAGLRYAIIQARDALDVGGEDE